MTTRKIHRSVTGEFRKHGKLTRSLIGLCTIGLLASCASTVAKQVASGDRDNSGAYDGEWIADIDKGASTQNHAGQRMRCRNDPFEMRVKVDKGNIVLLTVDTESKTNPNGTITVTTTEKTLSRTFVDSDGKFRFEIPSDNSYTGGNLALGEVTYIISGSLAEDQRKGLYTIGMRQFNNAGCSQTIEFTRT